MPYLKDLEEELLEKKKEESFDTEKVEEDKEIKAEHGMSVMVEIKEEDGKEKIKLKDEPIDNLNEYNQNNLDYDQNGDDFAQNDSLDDDNDNKLLIDSFKDEE